MTTEKDMALQQFRREYGRMCVLVARAIQQGHDTQHVMVAARGKGFNAVPVYTQIRSQRALLDVRSLRASRVGVGLDELIKIGYEARSIIESEWMVVLPTFAEV